MVSFKTQHSGLDFTLNHCPTVKPLEKTTLLSDHLKHQLLLSLQVEAQEGENVT